MRNWKILVGPFERFRENFFSCGFSQPDLYLVHPRSVLGSVVENKTMGSVNQESGSRDHRLQDAGLALFAQVIGDVGFISHKPDQRFRIMGVEIINDKMPLADFGLSFDRSAHMIEEIRFIAGWPMRNRADFAASHHEVDNEGLGAVALVHKLLVLDSVVFHGQGFMLAFQRLHSGQLDDFKLVMTLSEWAFEAQHIPGSINVTKPRDVSKYLDPDDEIVVYCSNEKCIASQVAYKILDGRGYKNIRRYAGGLVDWEEAGYPLEGTGV